jgi:uncharacterized protein YmfQ (DUF2313 family)
MIKDLSRLRYATTRQAASLDTTARYAQIRAQSRIAERPLIELPAIPGELELQARWFAGDVGRIFTTTANERLQIVQVGFWNREAGPDFQDAAVRLADGEVKRGAIEIDLLDRNWELHGHATGIAFDATVLHVFLERSGAEFFTRTTSHRLVPQVQLDLTAISNAGSDVPLAHAGRCVAPLRDLGAERIKSVLDAAAQFRLQRKAERLRKRIEAHGRDEALYQAMAEAVGYKQNRLPFTLVAQRMPLAFLQENRADAEALLFGVAGFLDAPSLSKLAKSTRTYLRLLWDKWWKYRDQFARLVLPAKLWKMSGARPLNHPHRRLGALATLVANWKRFASLAHGAAAADIEKFLTSLHQDFWSLHYTLASKRAPAPLALIGDSRVAEILANVIYPLAITDGCEVWSDYCKLRAQLSNQSVRIAAARLFANDSRQREFLRRLAGQQGLLQIYEDFCLRDASDCARCPFPEQVRNW